MINTLSNNNKSTGSCNDEENEIRVGRSTSSTLAFAGKSSSDGVNFIQQQQQQRQIMIH